MERTDDEKHAFQLKCLVKCSDIRLCCFISYNLRELFALITHDNNVVLYNGTILKCIPWLTEPLKKIQALCFDPTATWLLLTVADGALYILPALKLLKPNEKIDCKWSIQDCTYFPRQVHFPNGIPSSLVWWQTNDCNQNAIIGHDTGFVSFISLTDGKCLGTTGIKAPIAKLYLIKTVNCTSLLIIGRGQNRWHFTLEQSTSLHSDNSKALKMTISQRIHQNRKKFSGSSSQNINNRDFPNTVPKLMPELFRNAYVVPQYSIPNSFATYFKTSQLLTIIALDLDQKTVPITAYQLMNNTHRPILMQNYIVARNENENLIYIFSTKQTENKSGLNLIFNEDALLETIHLDRTEYIIDMFPLNDDNQQRFICVVVTMKCVYKIEIHHSRLEEQLNNPDYLLSTNEESAIQKALLLYAKDKVPLLKRVLKLALLTNCRLTLLKFIQKCLETGNMPLNAKIHMGNLALLTYCQSILQHYNSRSVLTKRLIDFLRNGIYDQIVAINFLVKANQWDLLNVLAKVRGVQIDVLNALCKCNLEHLISTKSFQFLLSDPSFTVVLPLAPFVFLKCIQTNLDQFPNRILQRFLIQMCPSQQLQIEEDLIETYLMCLIHLIQRIQPILYDFETFLYKVDTTNNWDLKIGPDEDQLLRTKLHCGYEHAAFIRNSSVYTMGMNHSGCLGLGPLLKSRNTVQEVVFFRNLKLNPLSINCGRKHTLVLTNSGVFSFGSNTYGQLGVGPLIQSSCRPQFVGTICDCITQICAGQYHSLVLSSNGKVYSWGWGVYGQLGHGNCANCFVPELVEFAGLAVQIAAGHAHSLILDDMRHIYGFGSNAFGQIAPNKINVIKKSTKPLRIHLDSDENWIKSIATGYFHSVVEDSHETLLIWGSTPQTHWETKNPTEANVIRLNQEHFSQLESFSLGSTHLAIICCGDLYFGRTKNPHQLEKYTSPKQSGGYTSVSCGLDYIMALDSNGKLWAWGSKIIMAKNDDPLDKNQPIEITGLPALLIHFDTDICDKPKIKLNSFFQSAISIRQRITNETCIFRYLNEYCDEIELNQRNLHHLLTILHEKYNSDSIQTYCIQMDNLMAASKILFLNGKVLQSFQIHLKALKQIITPVKLVINSPTKLKEYSTRSNIFITTTNGNSNTEICLNNDPNKLIEIFSTDEWTLRILNDSVQLLQFYLNLLYTNNTNPMVVMRVLAKCFEFWMDMCLPVVLLESILIQHLDVFLYPLASLLFCKNNFMETINNNEILKQFSTKFCLKLCAMVVETANKA